MMKTLLKLNYLFALVLVSIALSSCSKDEDASPSVEASKLLGEWKITGIFKNGKSVMVPDDDWYESYIEFDDVKQIFGAAHNGDGRFNESYYINIDGEEVIMSMGSWKLNGNTLRMNDEYDYKIRKLTDTELEYEFEEEDYGTLEIRAVPAK